jgi:UDP-GlcNAc:undecaprenyl-phosphate GlcNAc-1-phosphate transferase
MCDTGARKGPSMLTYLVAFALSFSIAAALTPLLRVVAPYIGGLDRLGSSRKVHSAPIPRIGGVAIVVAFFVPLVGLFVYHNDVSALFLRDPSRVVGLFVGGLAIAALGFFDDLHGAGARLKFAVQLAVGLLVFALGYRIEVLANPFGEPFSLGVLSLPFSLLWFVGIVNAMNLIDGLDGLAGGIAAIVVGLTFAVAFNRPDVLLCLFMAALGGALVGFLLYNFNPATIFMGDTGSMFLGFVLAVTTVASSQKSSTAVAMLVPIIGLGLPIADTLLAMLRRALRGRPLFSADREHIHHKLLALGFTHRQAVLALYCVCLVLALAAFAVSFANSRDTAIVLLLLGFAVVASLRGLGYLRLDPLAAQANRVSRTRNSSLRGVVRDIGDKLREADRVEVVWDAVKYLAPALEAREMTLSVIVREEAGEQVRNVLSWRAEPAAAPAPAAACRVRLDLETRALPGAPREPLGEVQVVWSDGRGEVRRDDEIALEMLVDHVEGALARIRRSGAGEGPPEAGQPPSKVLDLRRRSGPN